MQKIIFWNNFY